MKKFIVFFIFAVSIVMTCTGCSGNVLTRSSVQDGMEVLEEEIIYTNDINVEEGRCWVIGDNPIIIRQDSSGRTYLYCDQSSVGVYRRTLSQMAKGVPLVCDQELMVEMYSWNTKISNGYVYALGDDGAFVYTLPEPSRGCTCIIVIW